MSAAETAEAARPTASVVDMADAWAVEDLEALIAPGPIRDFIRGFLQGLFGVPS
jgi:hypothetical protein